MFRSLRHLLRPTSVAIWMALVCRDGLGQPPVAGTVYGRSGGDAAVAGEPAGQAERIVATMLGGLARAESISARVRQRVRVGDRVLVGAGRYVQLGTGIDQRFRHEWSMQGDTEAFELLEVSDGVFTWKYRRTGSGTPQLERLDVRRVREKLEQMKEIDRFGASPYLGGIQRSLGLLRQWFRFEEVEATAIDDVAVWSIVGRWSPARLAELLPKRAEEIRAAGGLEPGELPDGMPWSVRLSIGRRELFPFRIEWLAVPGERPVSQTTPEPIAVMELYDVSIGGPVDDAAFVYKPAAAGLIDVTEGYVDRLQPMRP